MDGDKVIEFWRIYVKKGSGFRESHWREEKDFHNIVTKRVEQQKKIRLAGKGHDEDKGSLEPYCGDKDALISTRNKETGTWETVSNEQILVKKKNESSTYKDEDNLEQGSTSTLAVPPEQKYKTRIDKSEAAISSQPVVRQPGRHLPPTPEVPPGRQSGRYEQMGAVGGYQEDWQGQPRQESDSVQGHVYPDINYEDTSSESRLGAVRRRGLQYDR